MTKISKVLEINNCNNEILVKAIYKAKFWEEIKPTKKLEAEFIAPNVLYTKVYDEINVIEGADPTTIYVYKAFSIYTTASYSKDKNNVYYRTTLIEGADPDTFRTVGYEGKGKYMAEDKNNKYSGAEVVELSTH